MERPTFFRQLFDSIAERGREVLGRPPANGASADELCELCRSLLRQRGEAGVAALAQEVVDGYRDLDDAGRRSFFAFLNEELAPDPDVLVEIAAAYARDPSVEHLRTLARAVEAPRQELFRRMNMASTGTETLVALRAALLDQVEENPALRAVDTDLLHLFSSWFNRGFLTLQRIDWRTPALILEKLIVYESVHAISGWDDLRRRLGRDRRCLAFFHPALPDEPLIFVEVALVRGMAASVQPLLDPGGATLDPHEADSAIFYSINNCQKGLRGVSFGSFLVKQVAAELQNELPNLKTFATLSPVTGFRSWLEERRTHAMGQGPLRGKTVGALLDRLERPGWQDDSARSKELREPVMSLSARYLLHEKRDDGWPRDPVARFHLNNGARLERVNWLGDASAKGLHQSLGIMVNYVYRLDQLERNHEAFVNQKQIRAARAVSQMAATVPLDQREEQTV